MAVSGIGSSSGQTVSRQTLATNFEAFLTLLTTQLQHQNPLEPLDTNQFTQQLVSFAGVEQQLRTNDQLESLLTLQKVGYNVTALGFVGAHVTVDGASTELRDGLAVWYLSSPSTASAHIEIQDEDGNAVYTETKALNTGTAPFQWNGRTSTGTVAPAGTYKIVIAAQDAAGNPVAINTSFSGVVDQVDVSGEEPLLLIGSTLTTMDKIRSVQRLVETPPPTETPEDPDDGDETGEPEETAT
jgi:flagellar basal-body rod modification protein FlgD